jgi:hypothetical protein
MRFLVLVAVLAAAAAPVPAGEAPPPDGAWRPHLLSRCQEHPPVSGRARPVFTEALELFEMHNGGDAVSVLELGLSEGATNPWSLLLLAQIYLLAGQGEPHCQPTTGPAAMTGDWALDQARLLARAEDLLNRLADRWPDDAIVDFLLADARRANDDSSGAAEFDFRGRSKCSHPESFDLLRRLRQLGRKPARVIAPIVPEYPEDCIREGIQGEVVLDLLIDPQGRAVESVVVGRPPRELVGAAREALSTGGYRAAQVGYYPIWSWLRVPIRFTLTN